MGEGREHHRRRAVRRRRCRSPSPARSRGSPRRGPGARRRSDGPSPAARRSGARRRARAEPVGRLCPRRRRRRGRRGRDAAAGRAHAEVEALRAAGDRPPPARPRYVTLEPCAHDGPHRSVCRCRSSKPACAGVVVAIEDPDRAWRGRRHSPAARRRCRRRSRSGARAAATTPSLAPYLYHRRTGRPYVVAKLGDEPRRQDRRRRRHVAVDHLGRARAPTRTCCGPTAQAIVIGSGTALADRPALTVRGVDARAAGRTVARRCSTDAVVSPPTARCSTSSLAPTLVITTEQAPAAAVDAWSAAGAKVATVVVPARRGRRRSRRGDRVARTRGSRAGARRRRRRARRRGARRRPRPASRRVRRADRCSANAAERGYAFPGPRHARDRAAFTPRRCHAVRLRPPPRPTRSA